MSKQFGSWVEAIELLELLKKDFEFMDKSYSKQGQDSLGLVYRQKAYSVEDCIAALRGALEISIKNFEASAKIEEDLHEEGKNNPY